MIPSPINQAQTWNVDTGLELTPDQPVKRKKKKRNHAQSLHPGRSMAASSHKRAGVRDTLSGSKHITVDNGGNKLTINQVYLGDRELGPLDKFNIYSWKALGHEVNIHTHPFTEGQPQSEQSLGLEPGDVNLFPLNETLRADALVTDVNSPQVKMTETRGLLNNWLGAIPKDSKPTREHIFNMVDLSKSYLGGTQQGLTMDMKVGPSPHLQAYADSFNDNLVSYTRGGNTAELPENQAIGTMQESDVLRSKYAENFNSKIKTFVSEGTPSHDDPWFNKMTGYHGRSYSQSKQWIDVATKTPNKEAIGDNYPVYEPGGVGHGPFRVYKHPSDQTNKGMPLTNPADVYALSLDTLTQELDNIEADEYYYDKAYQAAEMLPRR